MKKLISIIITAALSMSAVVPTVMAAPIELTESQRLQTALESTKSKIDVPEEYSEFTSSMSVTESGMEAYVFNWRTKDGDKSMRVRTNGDVIMSYYNYRGDYSDRPYISEMSTEDAKNIALEFIDRVKGNYPYEIKFEDNSMDLYSSTYDFALRIYIGGIPLDSQMGHISINRTNGAVESFNIWYDYISNDYKSPDEMIGEDKAKEEYAKNLGLKLVYRTSYDDEDKLFAYPVYVQKYTYGKYINAMTGDVYDQTSSDSVMNTYSLAAEDSVAGGKEFGRKSLTTQEIAEIDKVAGLISTSDIEKQLRDNKYLNISKSAKFNYMHLEKKYGSDDEYTYYISMSGDEKSSGNICVNAKTGEIISFNRYDLDYDYEDLTFKDDKILKTFAGDKAKEYEYDEESKCYKRYVNDIEVEDDTVCIEMLKGNLIRYSINYSDVEFPSVEGAMSQQEAANAMFAAKGYELAAVLDNKKAVPVYKHENVYINPFTGAFVDWQNREIAADENAKIEYTDISGHYAKEYIEKLAEYGVGFEGGEFKPDEKITQKDYLALLSSMYNRGITVLRNDKAQAEYVYSNAVGNNIITSEERNDDAIVTRETAVIYMIRAMGAEDYAKYNEIYVTPFDDVTVNKGYIALLAAMGVVSGNGGQFNPNREITRAESAIMIYNYLTK